jgi:hypothetical protein
MAGHRFKNAHRLGARSRWLALVAAARRRAEILRHREQIGSKGHQLMAIALFF